MQEVLTAALTHHQQGRLNQARVLYEQILTREPDHVDALHLLGVMALQQGKLELARQRIGRAIAINPGVPAFHANLAEVYRAGGQLDHAIGCCQTALQLQPEYAEAANHLGLAYQGQGKYPQAIEAFETALRLKPSMGSVHNNLGNTHRLAGNVEQALHHFRQAAILQPTLAEAHSNLGQFLLEQQQPREALRHCREAVRLAPHLAEAHSNLGNVLRELGQLSEARACYAEALRLNPNLAMVHNNMGQCLQEEGKLTEAQGWYRRALDLDPRDVRIQCNHASNLADQEDYSGAIQCYEAALSLDASVPEIYTGMALLLVEQGQPSEALARLDAAIRLKPTFSTAHSMRGNILEEIGQLDDAVAAFRQALRHNPEHTAALGQLATLKKKTLSDDDVQTMLRLVGDPDLTDNRRYGLHYGLAQVFDARGDYARAAEHLRQANALRLVHWRAQGKGYDPDEHSRFVDRLIGQFTPDFYRRIRGLGSTSERPIFIVGLPRSATTLTEQILASHSQVFGAGELRLARDIFETSVRDRVHSWNRTDVERVAVEYLARLNAFDADRARFADKMPDNYLHLGWLTVVFPQAQFIHTRRDVRDVAVSCWMTNFRQIRWACDPDHIARRFLDYRRLMDHWRKVLPVEVLEVDYEQTVADLEGTARKLVAWCGLEWEPSCVEFHRTQRSVRTASVTQVRQPIYTSSVQRWKNYEPALATLFDRLEPNHARSAAQ